MVGDQTRFLPLHAQEGEEKKTGRRCLGFKPGPRGRELLLYPLPIVEMAADLCSGPERAQDGFPRC